MRKKFNGQIPLDHFAFQRHFEDCLTVRDKVEHILLEYPRTQIDKSYFLSQCVDIANFRLKEWRFALLYTRDLLLHAWQKQRQEKEKNGRYRKNR